MNKLYFYEQAHNRPYNAILIIIQDDQMVFSVREVRCAILRFFRQYNAIKWLKFRKLLQYIIPKTKIEN
jgi:hypothetical protein